MPDLEPEKLSKLISFLHKKELRHVDILIFLMHTYKNAAPYLKQGILEILLEDERVLEGLMSNFGEAAQAAVVGQAAH